MVKFVCDNYNEMSRLAADIMAGQITGKPFSVLGLPTGDTPIGAYMELAKKRLDFSGVSVFCLGEYYPINRKNNQSHYYQLFDGFINKINMKRENVHILNGETDNPDEECKRFDEKISHAGGMDMAVLGIGVNGHIGFNEPSQSLVLKTHLCDLTARTIEENSKFFGSDEVTPHKSLTMGMDAIFSAKRILLLANGNSKADAVSRIFSGAVTTSCPATMLNLHHDVTIIMDKEAAAKIQAE